MHEMPFFRFTLASVAVGQLLSVSSTGGLLPGVWGTALPYEDGVGPQAQVIDQRDFNALYNVPPPSLAGGFTVRLRYAMLLQPS
jgi:hypothetical protein